MKPLAIIPARGGSKRLPRKNITLLMGKPLIAYTIEAAKKSNVFDCVCVSSDDDEILSIAAEYGVDEALLRPEEYAGDFVRVPHVCKYLIEKFEQEGRQYDSFGVILPTSPLVIAEDIQKAYRIFKENDTNYVGSYVQYEEPPQNAVWVKNGLVERYFSDADRGKCTHDMEKLYYMDGSILFAKTDVFLQEGDFFLSKTAPYFIPRERSSDIDTSLELKWAEFRMECM